MIWLVIHDPGYVFNSHDMTHFHLMFYIYIIQKKRKKERDCSNNKDKRIVRTKMIEYTIIRSF